MNIVIPDVDRLAEALSHGISPVQLYDAYTAAVKLVDPQPSEEELKRSADEFRARVQFAWGVARAESIKNGGRKPAGREVR